MIGGELALDRGEFGFDGGEFGEERDERPQVNVRLNRPQTAAYKALQPGMTVVTPWGRGVGKSKFQRLTWYLQVAAHDGKPRAGVHGMRGVRTILLAPTFKQAVDVHAASLEAEIYGEWKFLGGRLDRSKYRVKFPGGSWIQFFGAENADAVRGIRCDYVTVDECDDVDPDVYDAIVQPWLSEPWSHKMRLLGGTPRRGRHGLLWKLHDLGRSGTDGFFSVHATYKDAPENVSQDFVEKVRLTTPPEIFQREWECDFDSAEGLVYNSFLEGFHVRKPDPKTRWTEIIIGADHGFEDPGVFLVIGVAGSGYDAICHVLSEVYLTKHDNTWWAAKAREMVVRYPRALWYCDPSRPDRVEDYRKVGARIAETDNSIDPGVAAVQDRLTIRTNESSQGAARLYVDPSCRNTIREFGLYRRKRNPRNRSEVLEAVEDKYNHAMDALRYAIFSRFGGPTAVRNLANLPSY